MFLGNTSSSTSSCESTACFYAGYTNSTSFAILANVTTTNVCNAGMTPTAQPAHSSALRLEPVWLRWTELVALSLFTLSFFV
uniref:Uncharacterized protein n=1 Tax=Zea mays TaxID=4577 RepID=B8A3H6_MAIZE|nr:unknown [Zea mays]